MHIVLDIALAAFGYGLGSLPFAIWVTRWLKGVDVRASGSRHATATNTFRQVGFAGGVFVFILDLTKGFFAVYLARTYGNSEWVAPLCAALVVIGHCWPVTAGFRGGMGLATSGGAILAVNFIWFMIGVGLLVVLVLLIRHSARASVFASLSLPWGVWIAGFRGELFWTTLGIGIVVAIRFLDDWNREYRELWLDRPD